MSTSTRIEAMEDDRTYTIREVFAMGAFRFAMGAIAFLGFVFVLTTLKGA